MEFGGFPLELIVGFLIMYFSVVGGVSQVDSGLGQSGSSSWEEGLGKVANEEGLWKKWGGMKLSPHRRAAEDIQTTAEHNVHRWASGL